MNWSSHWIDLFRYLLILLRECDGEIRKMLLMILLRFYSNDVAEEYRTNCKEQNQKLNDRIYLLLSCFFFCMILSIRIVLEHTWNFVMHPILDWRLDELTIPIESNSHLRNVINLLLDCLFVFWLLQNVMVLDWFIGSWMKSNKVTTDDW